LRVLGTEELTYKIKKYERLAEVAGLRVSVLTLAAGDEVPWHRHTYIEDQFFVWKGLCRLIRGYQIRQ
jgi:quercetin dioxygenase-like cupin family protein